jgi:hypothetical protein
MTIYFFKNDNDCDFLLEDRGIITTATDTQAAGLKKGFFSRFRMT